jgi:hypothetical protein
MLRLVMTSALGLPMTSLCSKRPDWELSWGLLVDNTRCGWMLAEIGNGAAPGLKAAIGTGFVTNASPP